MSRSGRWRLQLDDRPPDPLPDGLPFEVAAFEHQIGTPGRCKLGIVTMLPDEQVGRSPDVEVGDQHPGRTTVCRPLRGQSNLTRQPCLIPIVPCLVNFATFDPQEDHAGDRLGGGHAEMIVDGSER